MGTKLEQNQMYGCAFIYKVIWPYLGWDDLWEYKLAATKFTFKHYFQLSSLQSAEEDFDTDLIWAQLLSSRDQ